MTLNPITALSEQLQKLITEHGSAAILREHLALFKDQVVVLEKQSVALEKKIAVLESDKLLMHTKMKDLEVINEQLKDDNSDLRKQAETHNNPVASGSLGKIKERILLFLATEHDDVTAEQLAQAISVNSQVVLFYLEELKQTKMVYDMLNTMRPTRWRLWHEGRRYLVERSLIK